MRKKVESLKDHADFRADFIDILFSIDRHPVECDGSRRRCFKPIDAAQQRTLPRAGRSDDDDDFLLLDFDADIFQDRQITEFLLMWVISIRFFSSAIYFFSNIATTLEIASVMMRYRTATVDHISKEP